MKCDKKNCPILKGFEIVYSGEDDEKEARQFFLSLIKKMYKHGYRICKYIEERGGK